MSEPLDDLRVVLGAIEPSPAFESRTLARIDRERAAAPRRAWMFLAPVAVAALVILAVSVRPAPPVASDVRLREQPALQSPPTMLADSAPVVRVEGKASRRARRPQAESVTLSIPVNAHADQVMAVRRLLLSAGSVDLLGAPDANSLNDDGSIRMPALIEIKPIVITPVPIGQGGGSER